MGQPHRLGDPQYGTAHRRGEAANMARLSLAADFLISTLVLASGLFVIFRANVSAEPNVMLAIGLVATGFGMIYVFGFVLKMSARR